jgi:tetratricopeptide (TPR) repeat protein
MAAKIFPHRLKFQPLLGFLGLFLFCASAWGQTGSLSGDVKGEDGKGLQGALIKIDRTDIKGSYKVKTDKKGHYFHAGLPLGTYNVTLEVDGKDVDHVNGVRTKLGDEVPINFNMQEARAKQQALAKAAESGQLTKEQERGMSAQEKAALEKQTKERSAAMAKNKALNDAFNQGREALTAKQWDTAVQALQKGTELDPNQHVIWAYLADAYSGLAATKNGQEQSDAYAKGIDAYGKALALKPDDAAYHNNYALMLARAKKIDEAKAELQKAAQLEPAQGGKYYYNLGAVLVNTGQTAEAEDFFKKAIDADPNYAPAQFQYATALSAKLQTNPDGSVVAPPGMKDALEKYLALDPNGQFAEAAKGMLQMIGGKLETKYENPAAAKQKEKAGRKK